MSSFTPPSPWRNLTLIALSSLFLPLLLFLHLSPALSLGVNWGIQSSHPLAPSIVVKLLASNGISKVKLFDHNTSVLSALADTNIEVMVGIPNDMLASLSQESQASAWVQKYIVPFKSSGVNIKYVAVGNEPFLKTYNNSFISVTYPALKNVQTALNSANLGNQIKATVPMNADVISAGDVPSGSVFRSDISSLMLQIVSWLSQNGAPFTINIYPFISLYDDPYFPTDYAFFNGSQNPVVDGSYTYQNVFDASYDSLVVALTASGYGTMSIIVGEIGWPTDGDVNANIDNARKFNQGFLKHVSTNTGTPRRPNVAISFYLFSLIDEDLKSVQPGNFERHWGIFRYNGQPKYPLSLLSNGQDLVQASGVKYMTQQWCIYNPNSNGDPSKVGESITYACENSDCTSLGYGCSCNEYLDAKGNTSYAFNQYFQRQNQGIGTCSFNGLGQVVAKDPTVGTCTFIIQIASESTGTLSSSSSSSSSASSSSSSSSLSSFPESWKRYLSSVRLLAALLAAGCFLYQK